MATRSDASPHEAEDIFSKAAKNFRLSLSATDRSIFREYESPEAMVQDLAAACQNCKDKHWLSKICGRVDSVATLWSPFFQVMGALVQSSQGHAGLAWGAIQLVFLLGSNFRAFLEKILVMFEKITDRLPLYADYYEQVVKRWDKVQAQAHHHKAYEARKLRVGKSIGYVYADIIEFCRDACRIFSSKRGGIRYKTSVIADVFWKPFDMRFADLLDRMHSHQSLLHGELMLEEATFTEIQFEERKLDAHISHVVMRQIQQQLADLSKDISSQETAITSAFHAFLHQIESSTKRNSTAAAIATREAESLESRVTQLKVWINAPDHMHALERATACREPATCSWFADTPEYRAWKSRCRQRVATAPEDWQTLRPSGPRDDILFTTAKPGFGKTTLSSFIIQDLRQPDAETEEASLGGVLFYHFASETGSACKPGHAIRAMLAQLVHLCRARKDVIDALSVLYEDTSIGHLTASDNQVMECLMLILRPSNDIVLLADGIDECEDVPAFLSQLKLLHAETNVKTLLLGRPSIDISDSLPCYTRFDLDATKNRDDISRYLRPRIERLRDRKLLPMEYDIQRIVEKLTDKSTGMFLWASLMVKYLNCSALSLNDRREAIFESNTVEGIEGIYSAILDTLEGSYTRQREKVERIFWLVAVALRPLSVLELQFAISVKPGAATHMDDLTPNLESALPSICGALVEVLPNDRVAFIHLSFRDFITTPSAHMERSPFFVDVQRRHLDAACVFLSYQIYDVPRSPVAPECETGFPVTRSIVAAVFPLLQYALSWTQHLIEFTEQTPPGGRRSAPACSSLGDPCSKLLSLLVELTRAPLCVTAWIESSWMFDSIPALDELVGILQDESLGFGELLPQFPGLLADIQALASDLVRLKDHWGHLLSKHPSAIWTSSITAFTQSDFWYRTGDFQVSSLAPKRQAEQEQQHSAILIQSQVSSRGDTLGIVQVTPSRQYLSMAQNIFGDGSAGGAGISHRLVMSQKRALVKLVSQGWKVRYEQKSTQSEKTLAAIEYEIHPDEIQELLHQSLASDHADRFPFPVAMSRDLGKLAILRTLCTVREGGESEASGYSFRVQRLVSSGPASSAEKTATISYSPSFSPDGSAVVFAMKDLSTVEQRVQRRRLELWMQEDPGQEDSEFFRKDVVTAAWFDYLSQNDEVAVRGLVFHPRLPLIVYPTWSAMTAWWFGGKGRDLRPPAVVARVSGIPQRFINHNILEYLTWSVDHSDDAIASDDAASDHAAPDPRKGMAPPHGTLKTVDMAWFFHDGWHPAGVRDQRLVATSSSVLTERPASYGTSSRHLSRDHVANAVLWNTNDSSRNDKAAQSRILLHLPRLVPGEQTYVSLLECSKSDEWMRIVWNQAQQDSYSIRDQANPYLPAIISRKRVALEQPNHAIKNRRILSSQASHEAHQ